MVFSSITFLFYFLPIALLLYFLAPFSAKNLVLLIISLFFYAWGEPVYIVLMVLSIILNYAAGRLIDRWTNRKKACLVIAIIANLALLGFFKYADFAINTLNLILHTRIQTLQLPLPIGISFYTFQAMSYVIDLYRGSVKVQKNIINFGAYVSLFPQLIAGPIVRIATIEKELIERTHHLSEIADGIRLFICGLGKKVLLANNIGLLWDQVLEMPYQTMPLATAWLGAIAFGFQIYFDFSGYSDMAIGLGKVLGFHFNINFNYPYTSKSITEFWRRWHISLSTWFKEYVYIPLGGNRKGLLIQLRNIAIVWALTGLWHGAHWNFVLWGLYFGVLLTMEKLFLLKLLKRIPSWLTHIYTMFLVTFGWVLFTLDSTDDGLGFIKSLFGLYGSGFWDSQTFYLLYTNATMLFILVIGSTPLPKKLMDRCYGYKKEGHGFTLLIEVIGPLLMVLLCIAYLISSSYNPFLYFRF
ncbi:MAG: MBOAT family O-acyltransferase [Anaerovoracaceae bacterium]|jgi:alginate O-acetyltransferase complex protein AlgI